MTTPTKTKKFSRYATIEIGVTEENLTDDQTLEEGWANIKDELEKHFKWLMGPGYDKYHPTVSFIEWDEDPVEVA